MENEFYLDSYIDGLKKENKTKIISFDTGIDKKERFESICNEIKEHFKQEWEKEYNPGNRSKDNDNLHIILERQKKAIIGYDNEVSFFRDKIREYLIKNDLLGVWFPSWYKDIVDAIYHENWGLAGIAEWMDMKESTSAKIIGSRIYFMVDGKLVLQNQTISKERFNQLRTALLLKTPKMRMDKKYAEVYMLNGNRITIYDEGLTKEGQATIVFRKYIIEKYTFEEQAERGTIPKDAIPMFENMVKVGFNVAFIGPVRTAKSTFLETWQSYEDPTLEGIMVETDPEIQMHKLMPEAPIMQLVADGEELRELIKSLMRSDADYIILAEARDGVALYIAVKIANKGTRRVKITYHTSDAIDFCYDVADDITRIFGGDLYSTIVKVSKSFNYLFQFIKLEDKSQKRLKAIYEIRYDNINHQITIHQICKYIKKADNWVFKYDVGEDKEVIGEEENLQAFENFKSELKKLSEKYPMKENNVFIPEYNRLRGASL